MTKELPHISGGQLFSIMLLSRISAVIVYPQSTAVTFTSSLIAEIIAELLRFLLALPVIIYSAKGSNFHLSVWRKNRFFGWCGAIIGTLLLVGIAVKTLVHTADFAWKSLLPEAAAVIIVLIGATFSMYAAFMGVEALARSGMLFLIIGGIITAVVYLADIPFMETIVFGDVKFGTLFGETVNCFLRGGEFLVFTALLPFVSKKNPNSTMKTALWFGVISLAITVIICLGNSFILRGVYAEYPFTASASLSDIGLLKRLDGLGAGVWSLCALTRCGIMLFSAYAMARSIILEKQAGETQ